MHARVEIHLHLEGFLLERIARVAIGKSIYRIPVENMLCGKEVFQIELTKQRKLSVVRF